MEDYLNYIDDLFKLEDIESESVFMGATDVPYNISSLVLPLQAAYQSQMKRADDISSALAKFQPKSEEALKKAQKDMFSGAVLRTVAAAGDMFDKALGLHYGIENANAQRDIAVANYENQMTALENQVLNLKNELSDRFNKTVETNIMNLAAKNLRVTSGNVLELSKEEAYKTTEEMRLADSNVRLQEIVLEGKKKSAAESASYVKKQLWTGFAQSAINLGIMFGTGGGTDESWGKLWKGYREAKDVESALAKGSLMGMY